MSKFRRVNDQLSVSPQITAEDVADAAEAGFETIICNRPDGEEPGMPPSAEIAEAAEAAGIRYVYLPFAGPPPEQTVTMQKAYIDNADAPVLAYCRSGTRSITTWALGKSSSDERSEAIKEAADAGYDLSSLTI